MPCKFAGHCYIKWQAKSKLSAKARTEQVYWCFRAVAKSRHYEVLPQRCGTCDAYKLKSENGKRKSVVSATRVYWGYGCGIWVLWGGWV